MKLLHFLKKKSGKIPENKSIPEDKIDILWERWVKDCIDSPYKELMTYQAEVNNGGHDQYFANVSETSDLTKEMVALDSVLPDTLKSNLHEAYEAYVRLSANEDDEQAESVLAKCDQTFYENQDDINRLLEDYALAVVD